MVDDALGSQTDGAGSLPDRLRARGLVATAEMSARQGGYREGLQRLEHARGLVEGLDDPWLEAMVLARLAGLLPYFDEVRRAQRYFERADALANRTEDPQVRATVEEQRATLLLRDDESEAQAQLARALDHYRTVGDTAREAYALGYIGLCHLARGALDEAEEHATRAVELLRRWDDRRWTVFLQAVLGVVAAERGNIDAAERQLEAAAGELHALGNRWLEAIALLALGETRLEAGRPAAARDAYHAADASLTPATDSTVRSWTLAALASVAALDGELERARTLFDRAETSLGNEAAPVTRDALALRRGYLEVAEARRACARGDRREAHAWLRQARGRIASRVAARADEGHRFELRWARRLLEAELRREEGASGPRLTVSADMTCFRVDDGPLVSLERRPQLQRIFAHLVRRRLHEPGQPTTTEELFATCWAGERALRHAASNRVRVALTRLRKLGLAELLASHGEGVCLDPEAHVTVDDPAPPALHVNSAESRSSPQRAPGC